MHLLLKALVRILLIWAFLNLVSALPGYITVYEYYENKILFIGTTTGAFIVLLAILFILWLKSDYIVQKLVGNTETQQHEVIQVSHPDLYRLILKVMGIFLLVTTIPAISRILYLYWYSHTYNITIFIASFADWIPLIVKMMLGLWLIIGNKNIRKAWDAVQYFFDIPKRED